MFQIWSGLLGNWGLMMIFLASVSDHITNNNLFMNFSLYEISKTLYGFAKLNRVDVKLFKSASDVMLQRPDMGSQFKEIL